MQKPMIGAMYAPASSGPPRPSRPPQSSPALASSSITDNSPNLNTHIQHGGMNPGAPSTANMTGTITDLSLITPTIATALPNTSDLTNTKTDVLNDLGKIPAGQTHINHMQNMKMSSFLITKAERLLADSAQLGDYVKAVAQRTLPTKDEYEKLKNT
tara:strand:+ start:237 stop:707 length:471 start_codon:yes stop_codon:yes gene_type:complete